MSRGMARIRVDLSAARERVAKEEDWIAEHGGNVEAYIERYGARSDGERHGDGGAAIYEADCAALGRWTAEVTTLEAELHARAAEVRHAVRCTEWGGMSIEEIAAMMPDLAEVLEAEAEGDA